MATTTDKQWISCTDTARLIRAQLKRRFAGVTFSVRSSHGTSVDIKWTDGPTKSAVDAVAGPFAGGGFDGMIDLAYSVETWLLPDGSAAPAYSAGTEGSLGSDPGYCFAPPAEGARLVQFSAQYVFAERYYSERYARAVRECLVRHWSQEPGDFPEVREGGVGWSLDWDHPANYGAHSGPGGCDPSREFRELAESDPDELRAECEHCRANVAPTLRGDPCAGCCTPSAIRDAEAIAALRY